MKRQLLRCFGLAIVCGAIAFIGYGVPARADFPQVPFAMSTSAAPEICRQVALPTGQTNIIFYGFHVSNYTAATVYVQAFNLAASPTASATPAAAISWAISANQDRDMIVGENWGWGGFNKGLEVCCSTVQGTYTAAAAGACGFAVEYH